MRGLPTQSRESVGDLALLAVAICFAPVHAAREFVAASEKCVVEGNGRTMQVVLRAEQVALPRPGPYEFDLLANGTRVRMQKVMFGARK